MRLEMVAVAVGPDFNHCQGWAVVINFYCLFKL